MAPTAKARQGIADGYPQGRKASLPQEVGQGHPALGEVRRTRSGGIAWAIGRASLSSIEEPFSCGTRLGGLGFFWRQ